MKNGQCCETDVDCFFCHNKINNNNCLRTIKSVKVFNSVLMMDTSSRKRKQTPVCVLEQKTNENFFPLEPEMNSPPRQLKSKQRTFKKNKNSYPRKKRQKRKPLQQNKNISRNNYAVNDENKNSNQDDWLKFGGFESSSESNISSMSSFHATKAQVSNDIGKELNSFRNIFSVERKKKKCEEWLQSCPFSPFKNIKTEYKPIDFGIEDFSDSSLGPNPSEKKDHNSYAEIEILSNASSPVRSQEQPITLSPMSSKASSIGSTKQDNFNKSENGIPNYLFCSIEIIKTRRKTRKQRLFKSEAKDIQNTSCELRNKLLSSLNIHKDLRMQWVHSRTKNDSTLFPKSLSFTLCYLRIKYGNTLCVIDPITIDGDTNTFGGYDHFLLQLNFKLAEELNLTKGSKIKIIAPWEELDIGRSTVIYINPFIINVVKTEKERV